MAASARPVVAGRPVHVAHPTTSERLPALRERDYGGLWRAEEGGARLGISRGRATWSVREDVGGVVELKAGHGPWTRGWCAGRCSGRSERVISLAGRPACHLREMKGRAHRRNGCFWRYASLNQPAKTARRSLLDAPHSGRQIISAQSQTAMGVEPHPWALDLTSGNPGHQVLSNFNLSRGSARKPRGLAGHSTITAETSRPEGPASWVASIDNVLLRRSQKKGSGCFCTNRDAIIPQRRGRPPPSWKPRAADRVPSGFTNASD